MFTDLCGVRTTATNFSGTLGGLLAIFQHLELWKGGLVVGGLVGGARNERHSEGWIGHTMWGG